MKSFAEYYSNVSYNQLTGAMVYQIGLRAEGDDYQETLNMIDDMICPEPGSDTPAVVKPIFENVLRSELAYFPQCDTEFADVAIDATNKIVSAYYSSTTHQDLIE